MLVWLMAFALPAAASGRVLRVGTYHGIRGQFAGIQPAVDAARPGDWILVAPSPFSDNGRYGHPTNGDFAQVNFLADPATNCYRGNHQPGGRPVHPASAAAMQALRPQCTRQPQPPGASDPRFLDEVLCASQTEVVPGVPPACPSGQYPRMSHIVMHPLPRHLPTMPDPCAGVPADPWCVRGARFTG